MAMQKGNRLKEKGLISADLPHCDDSAKGIKVR
jgi:hypothetical protein